ncbi:MAG: hypothetical protein K0S24_665 [Sphingobacterium sp.]|jgi:hypothetical protein|nr:hypothetical protein [Sphingobacterium sp.]
MRYFVTVITLLFTFSCCTASCSKDNKTTTPLTNGNENNNPSTIKMKITIGTAVFAATLNDSPSAYAFKVMLPLTINMIELNNNEKYYNLPINLTANSSIGGDIKTGDLTLYGSSTLVLFYKNINTSYSYTKLGYIDNPSGLATALGKGNVVVKFENN